MTFASMLTLAVGETQQVALDVMGPLIIGALVVGALAAIAFIVRYWVMFRRRLAALRQVVATIKPNDLVGSRIDARVEAEMKDPKVLGPLWHEFDETLVVTDDGQRLYNTVEAHYFFNRDAMVPEYAGNRLLAAAPGLLAAFGVFGTFISLYIGLQGLEADGDADQLAAGVSYLMTAAGIAFLKSVVGVLASLVVTILEKVFELRIAHTLTPLQNELDRIYRRTSPEKSLLDVADYTRASMYALQELHERIGNRLQETVQTLATDMETAVRGAIDSALTPAMAQLIDVTSKQSTEVFDQLVGRFASSFTRIGEEQADMLNRSSERLNGAIEGVSAQFEALVEQSRVHASETAQRQKELVESLDVTVSAMSTASENLTSAAAHLTSVSESVETAGATLGTGLTQTAATLMRLYEKAVMQADELAQLHSAAERTGADVQAAAATLAGAAHGLGAELAALREAQARFQAEVRTDADEFASALRTHVSSLEEQVSKWLTDYSVTVEKQIVERMGVWDSQSRDYAASMLSTARALHELLDELQTRAEVEAALAPAAAEIEGSATAVSEADK